mgnify:CR=1 FL=1
MELLRPEATVLSLGRRVLSFDREGRPYHYFREGKTYKRALDGSLHLRYREGERRRRRLAPEEALGVYQEVLDLAEAHLRDERRREEVLRWTPEGLLDPTTGLFAEGGYTYGFADFPKVFRLAFGVSFR